MSKGRCYDAICIKVNNVATPCHNNNLPGDLGLKVQHCPSATISQYHHTRTILGSLLQLFPYGFTIRLHNTIHSTGIHED